MRPHQMHRRCGTVGLMVVMTMAALPGFVFAEAESGDLRRGRELLEQMEDARALEAFARALGQPDLTRETRAEIHVLRGIAQAQLVDFDGARESFAAALREDSSVDLPADTSPKIRDLFAKVRAHHDVPPPVPVADPIPIGDGPSGTAAMLSTETSADPYRWAAWTTLGVAVAAGVSGLALGIVAKSTADDANDLSRSYDEAAGLHDRSRNQALAANVLFGVAAAAAISSTVLFFVGKQREPSTMATITPIPRGAVINLSGVSW